MKALGIIWLEDIVDKLWTKHRVTVEEVMEIFQNRPQIRFIEKGYRKDEDVYVALGMADSGRYLSVFFIQKKDTKALVLSARNMSDKERRLYARR